MSHFEVEQKYRVDDLQRTIDALIKMDLEIADAVEQVDCYYRHPTRDFSETDEAFRLRSVGTTNCITYKGPKIDAETKTRCEEEVALAEGADARQSCDAIFQHLGFEPVSTVTKQRRTAKLTRDDLEIEFALDQIEGLGEFVEIEIGVEASSLEDPVLQKARSTLSALADQLELAEIERRGYLELLLELQA